MQLPSRLRETTLGDLLATLHREAAHGVLELIEASGRHAIHLRRGLVQAVETEAAGARLGDVAARELGVPRARIERARLVAHARGLRLGQALVATEALSPAQLDETLKAQRRARLAQLFSLRDAEVRFRVARPLPPGASEQVPLTPREAFFGSPRKRVRTGAGAYANPSAQRARRPGPSAEASPLRAQRLAVLGLAPDASDTEARAAYKRLVLALHPDRAHALRDDERAGVDDVRARAQRLASVVQAYRELAP